MALLALIYPGFDIWWIWHWSFVYVTYWIAFDFWDGLQFPNPKLISFITQLLGVPWRFLENLHRRHDWRIQFSLVHMISKQIFMDDIGIVDGKEWFYIDQVLFLNWSSIAFPLVRWCLCMIEIDNSFMLAPAVPRKIPKFNITMKYTFASSNFESVLDFQYITLFLKSVSSKCRKPFRESSTNLWRPQTSRQSTPGEFSSRWHWSWLWSLIGRLRQMNK